MEVSSRQYLDTADLTFFGLKHDPFEDPHIPVDVWMGGALPAIENTFFLALERREIVILCGDAGAGKSILTRRFCGIAPSRRKSFRLIAPASISSSQPSA